MGNDNLLLCYNRGCGKKYDPEDNTEGSCKHHSGYPVFHDAYKGWSCCKKKCTDFTEFLNIEGCTYSHHSNVKPPEPEKTVLDKSIADEIIEVRPPEPVVVERPPFDAPLIRLKVDATPSLKELISNVKSTSVVDEENEHSSEGNIPLGTDCKNNACKVSYSSPESLQSSCVHHPGYPVFHEGLKYWSCCTKRTMDFEVFLAQVGCTTGEHVWFKKKLAVGEVKCRLDWHQTGTYVYISVFGKKCDPDSSRIELSPVRLIMSLSFPEQGGTFFKELELRRVADVQGSSVRMNPSKIEIKLRKRDPGSWPTLEIARIPSSEFTQNCAEQDQEQSSKKESDSRVESVDLSCI